MEVFNQSDLPYNVILAGDCVCGQFGQIACCTFVSDQRVTGSAILVAANLPEAESGQD